MWFALLLTDVANTKQILQYMMNQSSQTAKIKSAN